MAEKDYKKILAGYHKTRKANVQKHKDVRKKVAKAKLRATTLQQMFLQASKDVAKHSADVERGHKEWSKRATELIDLQSKLEKAEKAKDIDEVKALQKEIKLVHNVAKAIRDRVRSSAEKLAQIQTIHEKNYHQLQKLV